MLRPASIPPRIAQLAFDIRPGRPVAEMRAEITHDIDHLRIGQHGSKAGHIRTGMSFGARGDHAGSSG